MYVNTKMTSLLLTTVFDVLAILLTVTRLTAELTAISGKSVNSYINPNLSINRQLYRSICVCNVGPYCLTDVLRALSRLLPVVFIVGDTAVEVVSFFICFSVVIAILLGENCIICS